MSKTERPAVPSGIGRGTLKREYKEATISKRIEALFLDNLGNILTTNQIKEVAKDPATGDLRENWHQRLSELRTDKGYQILTNRDRKYLHVGEYLLLDVQKKLVANKRVKPTKATWEAVLARANNRCEWNEGGQQCNLKNGDIDPVGRGTVKLTADHKRPHSVDPTSDPNDSNQWQALCGRHQVIKKNYWDNMTGKLNTPAIVQVAPEKDKQEVFMYLLRYYGYELKEDGTIVKGGK